MDFQNFDIKAIVEEDTLLVWDKYDQKYYIMCLDSALCTEEEKFFKKC